jgi:RNA polymerase sigma-70 factor (ECF subfamily)
MSQTELDRQLVSRLRSGDEAALAALIDDLQGSLLRLARSFCRTEAVAEEAVQETWIAVIEGVDRFEGRGTLRSWIFGVLVNQARKRALREARQAELARLPQESNRASLPDPGAGGPDEPEPGMGPNGWWETPPAPWGLEDPAAAMLRRETLGVIERALADMPESQRNVVLLCDVEGLAPEEVCNILGISGNNQRVLLHRGRARVRRALDLYMKEGLSTKESGERADRP